MGICKHLFRVAIRGLGRLGKRNFKVLLPVAELRYGRQEKKNEGTHWGANVGQRFQDDWLWRPRGRKNRACSVGDILLKKSFIIFFNIGDT